MKRLRGYRASILHFLRDPRIPGASPAHQHLEDGVLLVEDGKIRDLGPARRLLPRLPKNIPIQRYPNGLILPGFVDCHIHFPQIDMIASYGEQLLDWLNRHAYPAEIKYKSKTYARAAAKRFLRELLRNGTTTAMVFATVHPESVEALFEAALSLRLRLIAGKTLMDRNAPKSLLDGAQSYYPASKKLIEKWHEKDRLLYALTPRFAPTSSECQLKVIQRLKTEYPDVYVHTHLSENLREIEWVKLLFPWSKNYLDVYDRHGLAGPRSLFAHCVHLSDPEWRRLAETGSSVAFCPSSNLFLGSGLFNLAKAQARRIPAGIGTDIGAGTSFSLLRNLDEAYKIAQLQSQRLAPLEAFYMATLGGAKALALDSKIGNFQPGKEADFAVLDLRATHLMAGRMNASRTLEDKLFLLMALGDDRAVRETYVLGRRVHARDASPGRS